MTYFHLLLFISVFFSVGQAQNYYDAYYETDKVQTELPFHLKTQVKSIDDFIARFNGYHNAYGDSIDWQNPNFQAIRINKDYWKTWRKNILGSLLSERILKKDSLENWKFIEALSTIPKISKLESHMTSYLPVKVFTSQGTVLAEIELHYISLSNDRYEWVISDIHFRGEWNEDGWTEPYFMTLSPPKDYLPPNADGNGFLILQRKIKDTHSISDYVSISNEKFKKFESVLQQAITLSFSPAYFQFTICGIASFQVDQTFSIYQVTLH